MGLFNWKKSPVLRPPERLWLFGTSYAVALKLYAPRNGVYISPSDGLFTLSLRTATQENLDAYLDAWYKRRAKREYGLAVDKWLPMLHHAGYAIPKPLLKVFDMRRAWGRCYYTKGLVTLNLHLIKTPAACIEYIILHELCHFVVQNHSREFHALVSRLMPDWRERDKLLKSFARQHRIIQ